MFKKILNSQVKHFKSLDYLSPLYDNLPFTVVGLLTGLVCCGYAWLFTFTEKLSISIFTDRPLLTVIAFPLFMILSFFAVQRYAPGASGSGIPQVLTCTDKKYSALSIKFLNFRVMVVKIISSLFGVFAGAGIGREGPSIQVSASIANTIGHFFEKYKYRVRFDQLIIAGAAGGLAAAFNTPIGGIVYAIEELSQEHVKSYKNVLLLSVLISGFVAQLLLGGYLYLGYPQINKQFEFKSITAVVLTSFITGILGAFFSKLLFKLIQWRRSLRLSTQFIFVGLSGLVFALVFNFFSVIDLYSGKESINNVLFNSAMFEPSNIFFRFITPLISSMTGIAGGVFAPSLSVGAVIGGGLASLTDPALIQLLGLSGMIGFLTGVTRTPITAFVLVLEMTDRHSSIFPMILSALFATLGAHVIGEKSYYEMMAEKIKQDIDQSS